MRLTSLAVAPPPAIAPPHIEYWQLSPMLLVFGNARARVVDGDAHQRPLSQKRFDDLPAFPLVHVDHPPFARE